MSIGNEIKQIREERGLTQPELYNGLISKRQAIRFEQDEADVKGVVLLSLLKRLNISSYELLSRLSLEDSSIFYEQADLMKIEQQLEEGSLSRSKASQIYEKYRLRTEIYVQRLAIKVFLLLDEDLAEQDVEFLMDDLDKTREMTRAQVILYLNNLQKFPVYEQGEIMAKLVECFNTDQKLKNDAELYTQLLDQGMRFYLLEKRDKKTAMQIIRLYEEKSKHFPELYRTKLLSWKMLVDFAQNNDEQVKSKIGQRAQLLLLLGQTTTADDFVDYRRLISLRYHHDHQWTTGEIGLVARRLNKRPKSSTESVAEFMKHYSGLVEYLQVHNKSLSSYLNDYEY